VRALATSSNKRIASLPDLPTMAEVGLPEVEVGSGVGLMAPAGTPPAVIETLNREIAAIIADKGFHERMAKIGVDVVGTTAADYQKFLADDYAKWAKVVKAAGIEPQ
jgi:tripartite-type tricarboxylate transporter receptor subunit TctC